MTVDSERCQIIRGTRFFLKKYGTSVPIICEIGRVLKGTKYTNGERC